MISSYTLQTYLRYTYNVEIDSELGRKETGEESGGGFVELYSL